MDHDAPATADAFERLSDDLLRYVLRLLPVDEAMLQTLSALSRRFRSLAIAQFLERGQLTVTVSESRPARSLASLRAWLERHATAGLRRLSIQALDDDHHYEGLLYPPLMIHQVRQAEHDRAHEDLLRSLLAVSRERPSGPGAELASLHLCIGLALALGARWVAALQGLSRLVIEADICGMPGPLEQLTDLRYLHLRFAVTRRQSVKNWGAQQTIDHLPPALTSLQLNLCPIHELPQQLTSLTHLERLTLTEVCMSQASFECLTKLPSLRMFKMVLCGALPDCLPELTWLEGLHYEGPVLCEDAEDGTEFMDEMLEELVHLTFLYFQDTFQHIREESWHSDERWETLPPALGHMTRLHTLAWLQGPGLVRTEAFAFGAAAGCLRGVQRLALPAAIAEAGLREGVLQQATGLRWLALTNLLEGGRREHLETLGVAAQLPSLQRLAYELADPAQLPQQQGMAADLAAAERAVRQLQPTLCVEPSADAMLEELQAEHA